MSGFGGATTGGMGDAIRRLIEQQQGGGSATPPTGAGQPTGAGPGEPSQPSPGYPQYGQQGMYNALTQDMSRGFMGGYNFNNNMFGYTPYGNPYAVPPSTTPTQPPGDPRPPNIMPGPGGRPWDDFRDPRDFWQNPYMQRSGGYGGYGGMSRMPSYGGYGGSFGGYSKPTMGGFGGYGGYGGSNYATTQPVMRAMW